LDTVDANRALGLPDDCREYSAVRAILEDLGVRSVQLMTNNPRKLAQLAALDIAVTGRIPCVVPAQRHSRGYLSAKRLRMDHLFEAGHEDGDERGPGESDERGAGESGDGAAGPAYEGDEGAGKLDGSFCYWNHEGEPGPAGIPLEPEGGAPYAGVAGAQAALGVAGSQHAVSGSESRPSGPTPGAGPGKQ
jgi:GTP cyclohydrolase II